MTRIEVIELLRQHKTRFIEELAFVKRSIAYLEYNQNSFFREHTPMHVTGSTWVVNPNRDHILMLHHKKLDQWFQPGGHADGDENIIQVALKETSEETGLSPQQLKLVSKQIFDVDIHTIQANRKEPRHEHIDIRFLVEIDDEIPIPGNDESHQIIWVRNFEVAQFNNNRSTYRMLEKTRQFRSILAA